MKINILIIQSIFLGSQIAFAQPTCPTDPKQIKAMVQDWENREACNRMSLNECGIMMGSVAAGGTVTGAILAKRALFTGDSKDKSINFSCKKSAHHILEELLLPKAYALQVCTYNPYINQKEALQKYLDGSHKALMEEMEKSNKAIQKEIDKALDVANSASQSGGGKQADLSEKVTSELTKHFKDADKAKRANLLLKEAAAKNLSNDFLNGLDKEDRQLFNEAFVAYRRVSQNQPKIVPQGSVGLSANAHAELKKIIHQSTENKETALKTFQEWAKKNKFSSADAVKIEESIHSVSFIGKNSALFKAQQGRLEEVSRALKHGGKVTKELLAKVPLIDAAIKSPELLHLRNIVAAKTGTSILGILDPVSAFAESSLMKSNVFFRAAGKLAVKATGVLPSLVFASGNDNPLSFDTEKNCIADKGSELGDYHPLLMEFGSDCQGTVEYGSEAYENFLRLPPQNKIELLTNNSLIRQAYCPHILNSEPLNSWKIKCTDSDNFSMSSLKLNSIRNFSVKKSNGQSLEVSASLQDHKQCPQNYQYDLESNRFISTSGDKALSGSCEDDLSSLNQMQMPYNALQISDCCKGSTDSYCSKIVKVSHRTDPKNPVKTYRGRQ